MSLMNKYSPCTKQKELMESLGFESAEVDDHIQMMKVRWVRRMDKGIVISLLMDRNLVPGRQTVIYDIMEAAYKEGQKDKLREIKSLLEI